MGGLRGKVQTIYMDPPYGIRFRSNWQVSTRKTKVDDGKIAELTRQPEQIRAFRDTWELGIHSYLAPARQARGRPRAAHGFRQHLGSDR
jgi:adenine-specific DNA-methyltransferase